MALLEDVAGRLCAEDLDEMEAAGITNPMRPILAGWQTGRECYVASWDGRPQAVFGIADYAHDDRCGVPWMLSTGPRGRIAREFLKVSREFIEAWSPMYLGMFNLVDARHLRAQRWLMHLGFEAVKVHDLNGHPFFEFNRLPH